MIAAALSKRTATTEEERQPYIGQLVSGNNSITESGAAVTRMKSKLINSSDQAQTASTETVQLPHTFPTQGDDEWLHQNRIESRTKRRKLISNMLLNRNQEHYQQQQEQYNTSLEGDNYNMRSVDIKVEADEYAEAVKLEPVDGIGNDRSNNGNMQADDEAEKEQEQDDLTDEEDGDDNDAEWTIQSSRRRGQSKHVPYSMTMRPRRYPTRSAAGTTGTTAEKRNNKLKNPTKMALNSNGDNTDSRLKTYFRENDGNWEMTDEQNVRLREIIARQSIRKKYNAARMPKICDMIDMKDESTNEKNPVAESNAFSDSSITTDEKQEEQAQPQNSKKRKAWSSWATTKISTLFRMAAKQNGDIVNNTDDNEEEWKRKRTEEQQEQTHNEEEEKMREHQQRQQHDQNEEESKRKRTKEQEEQAHNEQQPQQQQLRQCKRRGAPKLSKISEIMKAKADGCSVNDVDLNWSKWSTTKISTLIRRSAARSSQDDENDGDDDDEEVAAAATEVRKREETERTRTTPRSQQPRRDTRKIINILTHQNQPFEAANEEPSAGGSGTISKILSKISTVQSISNL